MIWVWRLSLMVVLIGLLGLTLILRLGGVGPNDFTYPTYSAPELKGVEGLLPPIEAWQWQRSEALLDQSRALYSGDLTQHVAEDQLNTAKALALKAYQQDITFGYGAAQLLALYEKANQFDQANKLAPLASNLWPAHPQTHSQLADYWLRRENPEQLLKEWSVLLTRNASLRKEFYPHLITLAKNENTEAAFLQFIDNPPVWWDSFFANVAQAPENKELLNTLFASRLDSPVPLSKSEIATYTARLIKDGDWEDAKNVWMEGLTNRQLKLGGTIYDGGFEDKSYNTGGFSWQLGRHKMLIIEPTTTAGMTGAKALKVTLRKTERINFQHISQYLVLAPDNYTLKLKYKVDRLKVEGNGGLSWRIRCMDAPKTLLGEGTPITSSTSWSTLTINFTVPANDTCIAQLLRLESSTPYAHEHLYEGTLWFDEISITPVETESTSDAN